MATYTPVPVWLELPLAELQDWIAVVAAECQTPPPPA